MFSFLPDKVQNALKRVNIENVYELRIRANRSLIVNYGGKIEFLRDGGIGNGKEIILNQEEIEAIILNASNHSFYSITNELKKGFLTTKKGVRIGVAGKGIIDQNKVMTIADIDSLCIRIPHYNEGASNKVFPLLYDGKVQSTLLIGRPGVGKTSVMRDIICKLSTMDTDQICIIDERNEFAMFSDNPMCDILLCLDKKNGIEFAIRSLSPDLLVLDELLFDEVPLIERALHLGVRVLASMHGDRDSILPKDFSRYVFFGAQVGQIDAILDQSGINRYV